MSMSVNWTLNFPEVSFHAARVMVSDEDGTQTNPGWDPAEDLKQHLAQWAPDAGQFEGENERIVRRRDAGRQTILERLTFEEKETAEVYDDDGNITLHRVWQLELLPEDGFDGPALKHANGVEFRLDRTGRNELYVSRMNAINFLYDWLLTLDPRGRWGNAWVLTQNGVTEYDESVLSVAAFHDGVLRDHYFGGSLLTSEGTETTRAGLEEWISPKV